MNPEMTALEVKENDAHKALMGWRLLNKIISDYDLTPDEHYSILCALGLPPREKLIYELLKTPVE